MLGQGGMGVVLRAHDLELDRPVAIKLLACGAPTAAERFRREGEVLAGLVHPGLVRVYSAGAAGDRAWMVMELLEGVALDRQAPRPDALAPMLQVAEALDAVHAAGLVHRDLKPSNIMVVGGTRAVLVDFGIVHRAGDAPLTETGHAVGTLDYMAPEALRSADPCPSIDWWGFGATLHAIAEGRAPFTRAQINGFLAGGRVPPPRFAAVPDDGPVARVVRACLQEDPDRRPRNAAEIRRLVAGAVPEGGRPLPPRGLPGGAALGPTGSAPPGAGERLPRPGAWLGIGLALAGLAGLARGPPGRGSGPRPAGASEPPAPVPPASGLERAVLDRVVGEIEELAPCSAVPPGAACWDEDPVTLPRLRAGTPAASAFEAWLAVGGRIEDLGPDARERLREAGAIYRGRGLPSPFDPLLDACEERERSDEGGPGSWGARLAPGPARRWAEAASKAHARARAEVARLEAPDGRLAGVLPPSPLAGFSLQRRLVDAAEVPGLRRELARALLAPSAWVVACFFALRCAAREDPPGGGRLLVEVVGTLNDLAPLWYGWLAVQAPEQVLGGPPVHAPEAALAARWLNLGARAREAWGLPGGEAAAREAAHWHSALRVRPGGGEAAPVPLELAIPDLLQAQLESGAPQAALDTYARMESWIVSATGPTAKTCWTAIAIAMAEPGVTRPSRDRIAQVLGWFDAHPEAKAWAEERVRTGTALRRLRELEK